MEIIPLKARASRLAPGQRSSPVRIEKPGRWIALVVVFVLLTFLASPFLLEVVPALAPGDTHDGPVVSRVAFTHESEEARDAWEEERRLRHPRVYLLDTDVQVDVRRRLRALLDAASTIDPAAEPDPSRWTQDLARLDPNVASIDSQLISDLVTLARSERFRELLADVLAATYGGHVICTPAQETLFLGHHAARIADLRFTGNAPAGIDRFDEKTLLSFPDEWRELAQMRVRSALVNSGLPETRAYAAAMAALELVVRPNFALNEDLTRLSLENYPTRNLVRVFRPGDVLVTADNARVGLSRTDAALVAAHNEAFHRGRMLRFFGHVAFVSLCFAIISFYVRKFSNELEFNTRNVILLATPVVLGLAMGFFVIIAGASQSLLTSGVFPAGAIGMLTVLLLDVRMALLLVTWGCLLFGLQADLDYKAVIVGLFGGYTAVGALYTIRERREVLVAGLMIGAVNALVILILDFVESPDSLPWVQAVIGLVAGVACSLITISVLPIFEVAMGVVTDMKLLELSGLEQPLLLELEDRAPGTWQHSLNVAKLAEAAAQEIGASYLLVRAGCYFHDIGKMKKPEYFTENQVTPEDKMRHQELKPQMSTLIIRNHVKEGIDLAREAGLPERIVDFIAQHHGTSLIAYFYHKALGAYERGESKEQVRPEDYRYPGPKPQSIEAAIVMLADSVEATATAKLTGRSVREDEIQQLVRNTVFEKFNDGQFDECNLTMRDLHVIRESFVRTLLSRFHQRIDYPKASMIAAERQARSAG